MSFLSISYIIPNKKKNKINRKRGTALILVLVLFLSGCGKGQVQDEDERFRDYTESLFASEVSSDAVTLHYTLKDPEDFGIRSKAEGFGEITSDSSQLRAAAENMRKVLDGFEYKEMNIRNQITYDILAYSVRMAEESAEYLLYDEPMGLVSGIQTQLPVILSEYQFYDREDVEDYLRLMASTPEYFESLAEFERKKSEAGLFMADYTAATVVEQCTAFLEMGDGNYLYSTFKDRVNEVRELSEKEKSDYIQENALIMEDYIYPAYQKLVSSVKELAGTGKNEKGLCFLPNGKEYYEILVKQLTGTDQSVRELEDLTRRQITEDLEAMEAVVGMTAEDAKETMARSGQEDAEIILSELESGIRKAFPEAPETELKIKYVPAEMEAHLSPAFYIIPEIDDTEKNVIYLNQSKMEDDLTLFTTLAHEGYPGHLYQTVYYEGTDPDPVRSLFGFGGYVEGWATYAEMCSYYLTPLSKEQIVLLQKNSSIILALYALADMGIHYEGWSRLDTVAFFSNYGITDAETVEQIYELIIGSPANYLKYYIGYVEFLELKKEWFRKQEKPSQKEFHDAVLTVGPATFEIVEKYMWDILDEEK